MLVIYRYGLWKCSITSGETVYIIWQTIVILAKILITSFMNMGLQPTLFLLLAKTISNARKMTIRIIQ